MADFMDLYNEWLNSPDTDEVTKAELRAIMADEAEISARFYRNMSFGTAGLRGILGAGTNRMNRYIIRKATLGYARFLKAQGGELLCRRGVVIAHDNRRMSREFCLETAGVLAAEGIPSFIFNSLRPTPELSFAVRYCHAAGGVMITASHNPPEYNGYKVYDEQGCQLVPRYTEILTDIIERIENPLAIRSLSVAEAHGLISVLGEEVDEAYYDAVTRIRLRPALPKSDLSIVYSPQHGTGNVPVREVLRRCGYRVIPVEEQCFPDKDFINTKSPNPENSEAYTLALEYARRTDADIGITTDPDCDRLGVIVKKDGDYVPLSGNQSGAVLLEYLLSTRSVNGTLPADAVMCNTIVTSTLGDLVCKRYGVRVEKTLTGFKFIGDKIHRYEQQKNGTFVFGYEESYGCLISDIARDKDAVQASLALCEAAAFYKTLGKTLYDVLEDLYRRHGYFLDTQNSVVLTGAAGAARIAALLDNLRNNPPKKVGKIAVTAVEDYLSEKMRAAGFPASNVLRFLMKDGSWVAVRPSGTEPKCKYYYCVTGANEAEAREKYVEMRKVFEQTNQ